MHEGTGLFPGHLVVEAAQELSDAFFRTATNCQQEREGIIYHLLAVQFLHTTWVT